ncbi:MAG: ABC transporter permease [Usitatibacteraceae bacterium]
MSMRWRKVIGDLRQQWVQLALIAIVLALGTAGVVTALNARAILKREIAASFATAIMPDIALWFDRVTPELLASVAAQEGVAAVDARRVVFTRVKAKDGTWLPMRLTVLRDFSAQRLGVVHLHDGAWPVQDGSILIEQSGRSLVSADLGGSVEVRKPNGDIATLHIGEFVHDTAVAPSIQDRLLYAYVTPATATQMGQSADLDQLLVKMEYRGSFALASKFGAGLNAALKRKGQSAFRVDALPAGHPHATLMNAVVQVLGVTAALALLCSSALAGYMFAAKMRREVPQVGIMKTLGARSHQIALQYLSLVGPIVVVAVFLGLVGGTLLGTELVRVNATSMNLDIASWKVPGSLGLLEIAFALLVPLLAVGFPIVRAARMTARAAIHDTGITTPPVLLSRMAATLIKIPGSVAWTFSLRNTWRRPWRLMVMLAALGIGGALLLVNLTNYGSMIRVIDQSLDNQGYDIEIVLQQSTPVAQLVGIARSVAEVDIAEAWRRASVNIALEQPRESANASPTQTERSRFALVGYPEDTQLFKVPVTQGRAPRAGATDEVLVTRSLRQLFPQLAPKSSVTLAFRERRINVTVVGVVEEIGAGTMYANAATFEAITALGGNSNVVRIKTRSHSIDAVANALDQAFLNARIVPAQIITRAMVRDALEEHFKVVGEVIRMVALAAALFGAIVLAAATGLNVLERTRETGIVRTLGATPRRIAVLFLGEAVAVTVASALLSITIAVPLSRTLLNMAERTLLNMTVPMQFSMQGLLLLGFGILLVLTMVLLTLAYSLRSSVRESLAYE